MGEPPRSYEWSPGTARSLDRYNARAAGWEREWPRWPGTDTLRYHFGRFNQALEAAGFPARPLVFERSLPERVEAARHLAAAGEKTAAIADQLGVHPTTVRSYLRAGSCRDCGTAVVSGADRCLRCALERRRERVWTGAEIVTALRAWTAETGAPPSTSEWDSGERAAPSSRRQRDRWPSVHLVRSRFGSWEAALRAAGFRPRWRPYRRNELRDALRREASRLGRPPTQRAWATAAPTAPTRAASCTSSAPGPPVYGPPDWSRRRRAAGATRDPRGAAGMDRPPRPPAALDRLAALRGRPPHRRPRTGPLRQLARRPRGRRCRTRAYGVDA
jgi:hypothetical protein